MKAMRLHQPGPLSAGKQPLRLESIPEPVPASGEVLIRVSACAVCRTDLDEIEGRLPPRSLPRILGHQVVGTIAQAATGGERPARLAPGQRVGVAWIFSACERCEYCLSGRENLCAAFRATGRDADGGYAEWMTVPADFVHPLPAGMGDIELAPLLCAGAIGYRSLQLAQIRDGQILGLVGFGASGHLVLKTVRHLYPKSPVFVFTRSAEERDLARALGAAWTGGIRDVPPDQMHALIETTPAWVPLLAALRNLRPGGRVVVNAIRKEAADAGALAGIDYAAELWMEKEIKSVANVTREDVRQFIAIAHAAGIRPEVQVFALEEANLALHEMRMGRIRGAKVLTIAAGG